MLIDLDLGAGARHQSDMIGLDQFGANYLFNRVSFAEHVGPDGGFDEVADRLGVSHVRYPGGTIAETQFSLTDPENAHQAVNLVTGQAIANTAQHDLTPMTEFLAWADLAGTKVTIVLPSAQYFGDPASARVEAEAFVRSVLTGPHGDVVEGFELGNEWAKWTGSPSDYGAVANALALGVAAGAEGTGFDPAVAIQPSAKAARLWETEEIIAELSPEALDVIDAVVIHDYRPEPWTQQDISAQKIGHVALFEVAAGRELETILTEWNVGNASENDGLLQGAGILDLFHTHLRLGVDKAHIWPVLENNTTRLADDVDSDDPDAGAGLMIGGEIFRQMAQSLEGTQALNFGSAQDVDGDGGADLLVYGYEAADRMVIFTASLEETATEVTLDLEDLSGGAAYQHLWITETTVADGDDPTHHLSRPVVTQIAGEVGAELSFSMDPFQITRFEFALDGGMAVQDRAGVDDLFGTAASDVFVLAADGVADAVRDFDAAMDRLDVSAFGATGMDELSIREIYRTDGSVSWIGIGGGSGTEEVVLRFDDDAQSAGRLRSDHFVFAGEHAPAAASPPAWVMDGEGLDRMRGTSDSEIFVMADDGLRDLIRDFDVDRDVLDVSALGARDIGELEIRDLVRKDGSVSWVEVSDLSGEAEMILRFDQGELSADRLSEANFLFSDNPEPWEPEIVEIADTGARDDLRGTQAVEVFYMQDDGQRDLVRNFEDEVDLIDVSRVATEFGELTIRNLVRKDGSVSWIEVSDGDGEPELILRFSGGAQDAERLSAEDFIFA